MNLNDAQKQQVGKWIAEGLKLSDIQKRIVDELGVKLTYMEVRFLVDDLKLVPKDPPAPAPAAKGSLVGATGAPSGPAAGEASSPADKLDVGALPGSVPGTGNIALTVDALARPGSLVSGKVTFSDKQEAVWYLDQMGRLGLAPNQQGYRPSPADLQSFQQTLEAELAKQGF